MYDMKKRRLQLQNTKERQKMYEQKKSLMTSFTGQHVMGRVTKPNNKTA